MSTQAAPARSTHPVTQQAPNQSTYRATQQAPTQPMGMVHDGHREGPVPAPGTETKNAFATTEFWVYVAAVAGVLVASQLVGRNSAGVDVFRANQAWFYVTLLTIGYLGSRGLAKAGSAWRSGAERRSHRR